MPDETTTNVHNWYVEFRWINPAGMTCHAGLDGNFEASTVMDAIVIAASRLGVDVALCSEINARCSRRNDGY